MTSAGTVLAFDFGEQLVGVAVGEDAMRIAHPLVTIDARGTAARFGAIAALVAEWRPARLVVGLPLGLDGEPHELTRRAERFARQLEGRYRLPVTLVDERLVVGRSGGAPARDRTGRAQAQDARRIRSRRRSILQDYFDRHAPA